MVKKDMEAGISKDWGHLWAKPMDMQSLKELR
jgi:hypothetical protein